MYLATTCWWKSYDISQAKWENPKGLGREMLTPRHELHFEVKEMNCPRIYQVQCVSHCVFGS
jgi:hypothetical protein